MNPVTKANSMIRNCEPHRLSGEVSERIRKDFLNENFETRYDRAAISYNDQERYIDHCISIRKEFSFPSEGSSIRTVIVDESVIPVLTAYKQKAGGGRVASSSGTNVLSEFLNEMKGVDPSVIGDFIDMKKQVVTSNGTRHPFKGVVWKALQDKKEFPWLTDDLKKWAGDIPNNDGNDGQSNKAQGHLVDYVVYALSMLREMCMLEKNANKNRILSQMLLLSSVSTAGNGKKGFVDWAKQYKVPEKFYQKHEDIHTEGYIASIRRSIRAVGLITLTVTRSVSQSIYLVMDAETLRAVMDAAREDDRIIEIHHMLRGDQGVMFQHKVGGNALSVRLEKGKVPTYKRNTKN